MIKSDTCSRKKHRGNNRNIFRVMVREGLSGEVTKE